jgi:hypothetical protein
VRAPRGACAADAALQRNCALLDARLNIPKMPAPAMTRAGEGLDDRTDREGIRPDGLAVFFTFHFP